MAYLTIISKGPNNWGALTPELHCIGTAKSREDLLRQAAEAIALALEDQPGHVASVTSLEQVDADIHAELPSDYEVVFLVPAPMNPVSAEVARAIEASGLSYREVARQMGTGHAAISRMADPFYWGHSVTSLRKLAEVLGLSVEVKLTAA